MHTVLADTVGFDLLGEALGHDVEAALTYALAGGTRFAGGTDALAIFLAALTDSIRDIETHAHGRLFQRFLRDGPYEYEGDIPEALLGQRLTEEETAAAITFIYSFMVNSFKGAVTELLAAAACQRFIEARRSEGALPPDAALFAGDTVLAYRKSGAGLLKAADLHLLVVDSREPSGSQVTVAGVVEVKSGYKSPRALSRQLDRHIHRAKQGLCVVGGDYPAGRVRLGVGPRRSIYRISVLPSDWKLSRTFWFEESEGHTFLQTECAAPVATEDEVVRVDADTWRISLRWSKEAIAQAAYEMTFWYMEKVGEIIYARKKDRPKEWRRMTPQEAGRNAVKMMLYYAIRPYVLKEQEEPLTKSEECVKQRAIALYNTYGFGYALGMNFRNADGQREMLWPEDLHEILAAGQTKHGSRIEPASSGR